MTVATRTAPRVVTHRFGPVELNVLISDSLARRWYDVDWPGLPEFEALREHGLRPGARVVELGAHQGVIALVLSKLVGPGGHVVAVEPGAHNVRVAERNLRLNNVENVTIVRAAAGDGGRETVPFNEALNGRLAPDLTGDGADSEVPFVTLDQLAERFGVPDVVMVDVEGFEARVLTGAARVLAQGVTPFLVEVHVGCGLEDAGGTVEQVLSAFPPARYGRWVAPVTPEWDYEFRPLETSADTMRGRFYLLSAPRT
jgi:FkbM family methyltransferase